MKSSSRGAPKSDSKKQQPKTKSTMEAFSDLYDALGDVAKEMTEADRNKSRSRSRSSSRGRSGSYSWSSGEEDDDDYSSSDDSSKPTIPGSVANGKSMSVRDDLTVDSYALSLADKKRAVRERDSRDDSLVLSEFSDEYTADEY